MELRNSLSDAAKRAIERPLKTALTRDETLAEHRSSHRSGSLPKVASDPELAGFILDRVDTLTLTQIVAEVAANVAPDRRVSVSSVGRWWRSTGKALTAART